MNLTDILTQPIPSHKQLRQDKLDYRNYPLIQKDDDERIVDIAELHIAGQSYYSRPNTASKQPLQNVEKQVYLRVSIAKRLSEINQAIQASNEVTKLIGGRVELYVEEGLRTLHTQQELYNDIFPKLIRKQQPELSDKEVKERRDQLIASAPKEGEPSPHSTGAAFDICLRYIQSDRGHIPEAKVNINGESSKTTNEIVNPDYFEYEQPLSDAAKQAQLNRRVFYWAMSGALTNLDSGFVVNPTEWWHWSYGDQMWACLTKAPAAMYGAINLD